MDSGRHQFRVRWFERIPGQPAVHQSHRYRNEAQAVAFIARLLSEQPGVRVVLERREARIGPWERVEHGLGGGR